MYQLVVTYAHPEDPETFAAHYRSTHVPLAEKIPGMTSFEWMLCEGLDGSRPPHALVARLTFPDRQSALAGMGSPEGQAAAADLANFAQAGVGIDAGEIL